MLKRNLLSTDKEVTSGEIEVTAKLFGIPVLRANYDLCTIVSGGCPIQGKVQLHVCISRVLCVLGA